MRLVDDDGEALAGQRADLPRDHRELLQRGDDDGLARLERLLELAGRGVDVLDHAERLLELPHGGLELAVEDPTVGDHHDRVEDPPVGGVVQGGELMREPGDGEALAAPRGVLDQVALARHLPPGPPPPGAGRRRAADSGERSGGGRRSCGPGRPPPPPRG